MGDRSTIRYSYEDYLAMPEDPSRRYEIVDGELHVSAAPRFRHQEVVMNLSRLLANLAIGHGLGKVAAGPLTVRLHDEGVVEPDIVFIRAGRLEIVDPEGGVDGPPDLVVEVLSPSNRDYDVGPKRKQYLTHGVPELWLVDAEQRVVEVWTSGAEGPLTVREALTWSVAGQDFQIPLEEVFRG